MLRFSTPFIVSGHTPFPAGTEFLVEKPEFRLWSLEWSILRLERCRVGGTSTSRKEAGEPPQRLLELETLSFMCQSLFKSGAGDLPAVRRAGAGGGRGTRERAPASPRGAPHPPRRAPNPKP